MVEISEVRLSLILYWLERKMKALSLASYGRIGILESIGKRGIRHIKNVPSKQVWHPLGRWDEKAAEDRGSLSSATRSYIGATHSAKSPRGFMPKPPFIGIKKGFSFYK